MAVTASSLAKRPFRQPLYRRVVDYLWSFKTTPAGKCLVLGLLMSASLGAASLDIPLYYLVCLLGATALVGFLAGIIFRPRLEVAGALPLRAVAGEPLSAQFRLTNRGRRTAYDIAVGVFPLGKQIVQELRDGSIRSLAPGNSTTASLTLRPLRRGLYTLPELYPYSVFPFNVFRSAGKPKPPSPLLVLPAFVPLNAIELPRVRRYQPGGLILTSRVGESSEYIGSREYRPGDAARALDYRSWARLAQPVVREYQEEYFCRIALVLDTYVPGRRRQPAGGFPQLEAAVSLTAAVADVLARGEDVIDLFAAGPTLHVFRAGRHTAHLDQVLEILAGVEESRHDPCEELVPVLAQEVATLSAAVCVLLDWDAARRRMVQEMADAGCAVKIVLVRDAPLGVPLAQEEEEAFLVTRLTLDQARSGRLETI